MKKMDGKFTLRSYSNLKHELGVLDATIEVVEISIREFSILGTYKSFNDKIKYYSEKHEICVNETSSEEVIKASAGLYILLTHGVFDSFLDKFLIEVKRYRQFDSKKDGQTILDFILDQMDEREFKNNPLYKGYDYYRLLRNDLAHVGFSFRQAPPSQENIEKIFEAIKKPNKKEIKYRAFTKGSVEFDDFIIFSRIIKKIAWNLCQFAKPQSDEEERMLLQFDEKKASLSSKQFANYLRFELKSYGLDISKYIDNISLGE